jgi:hypothetical protein
MSTTFFYVTTSPTDFYIMHSAKTLDDAVKFASKASPFKATAAIWKAEKVTDQDAIIGRFGKLRINAVRMGLVKVIHPAQ